MNKHAIELNKALKGTILDRTLSECGKQFYLPMGIIKQSEEAQSQDCNYELTVAMASDENGPLFLPTIYEHVKDLSLGEVFPYAPVGGLPILRQKWNEKLIQKNPLLSGKKTTLPIVTSGLTHSLMLVSDLFVDSEDNVLLPELVWGNYRLIFEHRRNANIHQYPIFSNNGTFDPESLEKELRKSDGKKKILILNFPHNPTGYSLNMAEAESLFRMLKRLAIEGYDLITIIDDAYFGLFYEDDTFKESLFSRLADLHENLLAVKIDGASKEEFSWGLRIGFITFASKGLDTGHYKALDQKCIGLIRASISSSVRISQSLLIRALQNPTHDAEQSEVFTILKKRYEAIKKYLSDRGFMPASPQEPQKTGPHTLNHTSSGPEQTYPSDSNFHSSPSHLLCPLPFNSGYFMTFFFNGDADFLRTHLINKYKIGTISLKKHYLRIAFSRLPEEKVEEVYDCIYRAAEEVSDHKVGF